MVRHTAIQVPFGPDSKKAILEDIIAIELLKAVLFFLPSVRDLYSQIHLTYQSYDVNGDRTIVILSKIVPLFLPIIAIVIAAPPLDHHQLIHQYLAPNQPSHPTNHPLSLVAVANFLPRDYFLAFDGSGNISRDSCHSLPPVFALRRIPSVQRIGVMSAG
jgi:hypothetical protein